MKGLLRERGKDQSALSFQNLGGYSLVTGIVMALDSITGDHNPVYAAAIAVGLFVLRTCSGVVEAGPRGVHFCEFWRSGCLLSCMQPMNQPVLSKISREVKSRLLGAAVGQ